MRVCGGEVGFEPTVLAHTAFRERHLQPLGHLSASEDTQEWSAVGASSDAPRLAAAQLGGLALHDPGDDRQTATVDRSGRTGAGIGHGEDQAVDLGSINAPTHIAHGSTAEKTIMPDRLDRPKRRAASRTTAMTAWAVGSPVVATVLRPRATIASSSTATAPSAISPSAAAARASANAAPM